MLDKPVPTVVLLRSLSTMIREKRTPSAIGRFVLEMSLSFIEAGKGTELYCNKGEAHSIVRRNWTDEVGILSLITVDPEGGLTPGNYPESAHFIEARLYATDEGLWAMTADGGLCPLCQGSDPYSARIATATDRINLYWRS